MKVAALAVVSGLACGCAAGRAMVKAPVEGQCQSAGLKGCSDLADGAVDFALGDRGVAMQKLGLGVAQNAPEDVERFAAMLRTLAEGSGGDANSAAFLELASLLESKAKEKKSQTVTPAGIDAKWTAVSNTNPVDEKPKSASVEAPPPSKEDAGARQFMELTMTALAAPTDATRLIALTSNPSSDPASMDCSEIPGGAPQKCLPLAIGPMIVTDVQARPGCPDELVVAAFLADGPGFGHRWFLPVDTAGAHGMRYVVTGDQTLFAVALGGKKGVSADPRCTITWAGYRPRFVPQPTLRPSP